MDLNEIFLFAKVVDAQSFTGAARALGIPKSTISRKIAQLEERLGAQLLYRTTRKLRLTDVGAAYYEHCARIAAELEEAEREVLEMQAEPRGLLRITAPVEFGFLGSLAAEFLDRHPALEIDIELTGRQVDLIEEGFDLAIRAGRMADSTLIARKLGETGFDLYAAPSYLERHGTPTTPGDLAEHSCIIFGVSTRQRRWLLNGPDGPIEVAVGGRLATNDLTVARQAALAGLGIALLPPGLAAEPVQAGQLQPIMKGAAARPGGAIYAVYPHTRRLSTKVRMFVDFLQQTYNDAEHYPIRPVLP
ncbi:MAG: LysR family transcriptional regulator [Myxococcota bacterium]